MWLESMLDAVDGGCLWILPDLLPHADRQYLRASDLAFVHDLAVRVRQELDRQSPERRGAPEHVRRLRGLLGELADRIAPRR